MRQHKVQPIVDPALRRWMVQRLRTWFRRHQRPLPWRRDRDPYRIWVSEVMLQQTQVATVIPYFERFVAALPDVASLARASEADVLRLWEGLGYYRRARDLHRTAQLLVAQHGGNFPDDPEAVRALPGLGRYTANAVLSQAFDARLPILEANSQRLLSRLFGRTDDPRCGPARAWLWYAAEQLLPRQGSGEVNQALMELGALVCTPQAPRCDACPLAQHCVARREGLQDVIPPKATAPAVIQVEEAAIIIRRGERVLVVQRPDRGRWASLWEFPHGPLTEGEDHAAAAARLGAELTGLRLRLGPEALTVRHSITRYRVTLVAFEAQYLSGELRSPFYVRGEWLVPADLHAYSFSAPQRRLARALVQPGRQRHLF